MGQETRIIKGTVQGYAARKYPDFIYLKHKTVTIDHSVFFQDRVYQNKEFPKWSGKPGVQRIEYTELADYEVRIEEVALDILKVEVFMMPNYLCPLLKSAKKVYDIKAQYWMVTDAWIAGYLLNKVFKQEN